MRSTVAHRDSRTASNTLLGSEALGLIREDGLRPEGGKDVGKHSDKVDVKEEEKEEEEEEEEADDEEEEDEVGSEEEAEANVVNKSSTQSDILGYYSSNNCSKN